MPLVLGVDSSTQSTKVEVRDADTGALVATGRAPHPPATPPRSEQDPAAWWNALVAAIGQAGVRDVAAMSVAGQQHGLVTVDPAGTVLRPAKLWNDTESAPQAAELVRRLGAERWARAAGVVPVASITITKLLWLAEHEPEVLERAAKLLLPHDWLTFRLTGRYVTDRGDASGTGYWSPFEERWRTDVLRAVDNHRSEAEWADRLPDVLGPAETADWMAATVHEQLRLRGRPLVGPGTGDNMAAALGVGLAPGRVAVSIGTSGTVYAVTGAPVADPSGTVAGFADATGRFLPLVCTMNAALVTGAFARLLGVDDDGLAELALAAPAGAGGIVLVPYLDGERTPNRPEATGTLTGFRSGVTREEIARAAFEGVVCGLLEGLDALAAAGVDLGTGPLTLVGGGARSAAYRRVLADLSGRPVCVPEGGEHVATGACVQAAAVLHEQPPEEVAAAWDLGTGDLVDPDESVDREAIRAAYTKARA